MAKILNASPKNIALGTEDNSIRVVYPEPDAIPQHAPKFFLLAEKGPMTPMLVNGPKLLKIFGDSALEPTSKFFNHASLFASRILGEANSIIIQRVVPEDGRVSKASVSIYMDVLERSIPNYKRYANGDYFKDVLGNKVQYADGEDGQPATMAGYEYKFIAEYGLPDSPTQKQGTLVDPDDAGNVSTMYPIMKLTAKEFGKYYDNVGFSLSAPSGDDMDAKIFDSGVYPFELTLFDKSSGSNIVNNTLFGEKTIDVSFKKDAVHPLTERKFDITSILPSAWSNLTDLNLPLAYSDFEDPEIFYDELLNLQANMLDNELMYLTNDVFTDPAGNTYTRPELSDFSQDEFNADTDYLLNNTALFNFISGKSSNGKNYFSVIPSELASTLVGTQKEVELTKNTPIFMAGGLDGTIDNSTFETEVVLEMDKYIDSESRVQDTAVNVESIIYDSGFTIDTKKKLCNFVGLRKDTLIALTTHVYAENKDFETVANESAIATLLKNKLKLMPDSDYFGTPVMRGIISMGSGMLSDDSHPYRVPQLLEIAVKAAKYMGAGNGAWKTGYAFDRFPGSNVTVLKDLEPSFIPDGAKSKLWTSGLIWTQPLDRRQYHFPAMQTVYENDTSVLNSFPTALAICTLNKINADAWRRFTGSIGLSDAELGEAVEEYVNERVQNKFDGMFTIIPRVIITEADKLRGYSWHLATEIYAENMKSVMVSKVVSYRASDLV